MPAGPGGRGIARGVFAWCLPKVRLSGAGFTRVEVPEEARKSPG